MPLNSKPLAPQKRSSPAQSSVSRETSKPAPGLNMKDEARKENVTGVFAAVSMVAIMRGNYADAGAVSMHGPKVARELVLLGKTNEPVGKVLDLLGQAGPYTGIIFVTLPLLAQLAVNHERIDGSKVSGIPGVMSKAALENQVKGELAEKELEILREQQEAEKSRNALADAMRDNADAAN